MNFRSGLWLGGVACVCVAAMALAVQPADSHEPFALFQKLIPVFKHDRCANCHGAVNPFIEGPGPTGLEHEAGMIGSPNSPRPVRMSMCSEDCHNKSQAIIQKWATPSTNLTFHDKNDMQLCRMQAAAVRQMGTGHYYDDHLLGDPLIADAFTGQIGGMRMSRPAPSPPLTQDKFNIAAKEWLDAGAGCGTWTGEIKQVEKFETDYSYTRANTTTTVHERANRTFSIDRRDGRATATIQVSGNQTLIVVTDLGDCTMTITSDSSWEGETQPNSAAKARIEFTDPDTYSIHILGPRETVVSRGTSSLATNCPLPFPQRSPAEPQTLSYDPYRYSFQCSRNTVSGGGTCSLEVDDDPAQMDGRYQRTIVNHSDAASPQSWLNASLAGISRSDNGASLPVEVTTTWNLKLTE